MTHFTQKQKVLDYLKRHGSITYRECMEILYINSPRDVIRALRKEVDLDCIRRSVMETNSRGEQVEVSFYHQFYLREC